MNMPLEKVIKMLDGYYTHIVAVSSIENLTRFGDNEISQNVSRKDEYMDVRVVDDKKAVRFIISKFDNESIKNSIEKAKEKLKYSRSLEFVPYPTQSNVRINSTRYFDKRATQITP
ncbi:MAG: hypothetical protein ACP5PA_03360, partial [Elusimicrobiales bacterium]